VRQLAGEIVRTKKAGGKIAVVCGPALVHTGAAPSLARLIRRGTSTCFWRKRRGGA